MRSTCRPHRGITTLATLAWVSLALAGCGGGRASNPFEGEAGASSDQLFIYIDNQGFNDIRVYALTPRGPQSLGLIPGTQHKNVRITWRQLDQLSFRLEVLAGPTYRTNGVTASPGEHLELLIPSDPSNAFVRPGR